MVLFISQFTGYDFMIKVVSLKINLENKLSTMDVDSLVLKNFTELDEYFQQYGNLDVQQIMLDDAPRLAAYKEAVIRSRGRIEGRVVLDVGSGTGILSVFCAQAGAKRVHAVEASPKMAALSLEVIKENGMDDVIQVHNCLVQDLVLQEKVDVIISEWMGFYLFHEGMLESVIVARDKFLKPDGFMIPESADLWVAPCELPHYFDFWEEVHGVKMTALGKSFREGKNEPVITLVEGDRLIADESVVKSVCLHSVTAEDIREFSFRAYCLTKREAKYQGLCLWFVCNFVTDDNEIIFFSTHPDDEPTHWKQTAIVFPHELQVEKGDPLMFDLRFEKKRGDSRKYVIEVMMLGSDAAEHQIPCSCNTPKCMIIRNYLNSMEA